MWTKIMDMHLVPTVIGLLFMLAVSWSINRRGTVQEKVHISSDVLADQLVDDGYRVLIETDDIPEGAEYAVTYYKLEKAKATCYEFVEEDTAEKFYNEKACELMDRFQQCEETEYEIGDGFLEIRNREFLHIIKVHDEICLYGHTEFGFMEEVYRLIYSAENKIFQSG